MTRPGEAEAVDPVAAVLFKFEGYDDPFDVALNADYNQPEHWVEEYRDRGKAAVAAAYPIIAAAVREQVARDIEAQASPLAAGDNLNRVIAAGYAAAIARDGR